MSTISVDTSAFQQFILKLQGDLQGEIASEIVVTGKAAKYWAPCEFGSRRGGRPWPNPGPRTVASGGRVYSSQAPGGFVFKNRQRFITMLSEAYKANIENGTFPTREHLIDAANEAGNEALELIKELQPKRAWFTHICHDLGHAAANAKLPENVRLAYDGLQLQGEI